MMTLMGNNLGEIGKKLDLTEEDVMSIRKRRWKDIIILSLVGLVISFFSFIVGFSNGNTEKYGMAYYPYAVVPLIVKTKYKGRWAIMGVGILLMLAAGVYMYLQGFEQGKIFYSNSIDYGVYGKDTRSI
jgi:hypothetical protein